MDPFPGGNSSTRPLVIIPSYLRKMEEVDVLVAAVASIRKTVSDSVDVLVVDDASPNREARDEFYTRCSAKYEFWFDCRRTAANEGFSHTVNVGLQYALDHGRDAVLFNADLEITTPGWVSRCQKTKDTKDRKAGVVGALLTYPTGLIQHAGIYFSLLTRTFDHLHRFGPGNLPEALEKKAIPVTGAFQYIRHDTLERVGIYDESFRMGWEDVDYCIRVFLADRECVYNPNIRGVHHEQMFRGQPDEKIARWTNESFLRLCQKWENQSFSGLVPTW